ncbi:DNA translocase FtsK [Bacillus wiedmannii]|uniref:DNA translocase FtsK n=1 Tax=Bacillus wiedmannii TaxID=1890302 RepID=UPI00211D7C0E|nr:DNA translocase FtsK [Bacillus wiedmannii]
MKERYLSNEVADEHYEEARQCVISVQAASVTTLQRRFRIGYTSIVNIIDCLEKRSHWFV